MTDGLTKNELRDVVLAALGDDWRTEKAIDRAVNQFEIIYVAAHSPGVEFENIADPRTMVREILHQVRAGIAALEIDNDGRVVFVPMSGERVDLSAIRMRKPKPAWMA